MQLDSLLLFLACLIVAAAVAWMLSHVVNGNFWIANVLVFVVILGVELLVVKWWKAGGGGPPQNMPYREEQSAYNQDVPYDYTHRYAPYYGNFTPNEKTQ